MSLKSSRFQVGDVVCRMRPMAHGGDYIAIITEIEPVRPPRIIMRAADGELYVPPGFGVLRHATEEEIVQWYLNSTMASVG